MLSPSSPRWQYLTLLSHSLAFLLLASPLRHTSSLTHTKHTYTQILLTCMWAQRLGHKNTSQGSTTEKKRHSKSRHRPFSSSPSPPGTREGFIFPLRSPVLLVLSGGKRDASVVKYLRSESFNPSSVLVDNYCKSSGKNGRLEDLFLTSLQRTGKCFGGRGEA